jgi:hypothetical protein
LFGQSGDRTNRFISLSMVSVSISVLQLSKMHKKTIVPLAFFV